MDPLSKKYYRIREVSEILGLPLSTLRYWEKEFPSVVKPRRNEHATRFYTPSDIEGFRMIQYLLHQKGMKIEAAKLTLVNKMDDVAKKTRAIDSLKNIRSRLNNILEALNRLS